MEREQAVQAAVERYGSTVRRVCMVYLKNEADTEDIFQTVFLQYFLHGADLPSGEPERAWILRDTINACKDLLKSAFRRRTVPLEAALDQAAVQDREHREVLEAVLSLPPKYREVVYLHYYEGYTAAEIGAILRKRENTVYSLLRRAREQLKQKLEGEDGHE